MIPFSDAKTYRNENLPERLRSLGVRSVVLLKAFITIETRNGWWNWQGDTGYLWGAVSAFDFSIEESKQKVEKNRKQGSFFEIKECPIIALEIGDNEFLMINLYGAYKYLTIPDMFGALSTVQDFIDELRTGAPLHILHADNVDKNTFTRLSESEMLVSYRSTRGTSKILNWNISRENADLKLLLSSTEQYNNRLLHNVSVQTSR